MGKSTVIGGAVAVFVLGASAVAYAQPYAPYPEVGRPRIVQSEPAVACQSQQDLRRVLTAYANGDRWRAHEAARACAILSIGTRVVIMEPPTSLNVWRFQTRQTITYRDVLVRVLTGPARGYAGYMVVDAIR